MTRVYTGNSPTRPTKTTATGGTTPAPPPNDCGCGCGGQCSCGLEGFERPVYFCGHLLTDDDLTLDQRYQRHKNRLYNRTLHGHGIVCGLRLTCDPDCTGRVRIDEGYAIDDCGNDLVACAPLVFDVVSRLRQKNLLIKSPKPTKGDRGYDSDDCPIRQCFPVAIRYAEEEDDFTTPLGAAGCGSDPGGCRATRIRETVEVDVLEKPPQADDPLVGLIERVECCFKLFSEGPFAQALKCDGKRLRELATGGEDVCETDEDVMLFKKLRALFKLHLEKWPDKCGCSLAAEVDAIRCRCGEVAEAICTLLNLARRSAIDCALGEIIPSCRERECGGWVVVGTVEVEDGCVVRVCNCPRTYVWSFANLIEVFLASVVGGRACAEKDSDGYDETCCAGIGDEDCERLLRLLEANPAALGLAASEPLARVAQLRDLFRSAFDFTRAGNFSARIVAERTPESARSVLASLGIPADRVSPGAGGPLADAIFRSLGLAAAGDAITLTAADKVADASVNPFAGLALSEDDRKALVVARDAADKIAALQKRVDDLEMKLKPPLTGPTHEVTPSVPPPPPAVPPAAPAVPPVPPTTPPPPPAPEAKK